MIRLREFSKDMYNVEDAFKRVFDRCDFNRNNNLILEEELKMRNIETFFKYSLDNYNKKGRLEIDDLNKKLQLLKRIGA